MANGELVTGFVLGVAATLAYKALTQSDRSNVNPVARGVSRAGVMLAEKFREAAAELGEVIEDTAAELHAASSANADARLDEDTGTVDPRVE